MQTINTDTQQNLYLSLPKFMTSIFVLSEYPVKILKMGLSLRTITKAYYDHAFPVIVRERADSSYLTMH